MKVFIAGSTGAIGRALIPALVEAGHHVFGMTSSEGNRKILEDMEAEVVLADALDGAAVKAAIAKRQPEAVINELTSLPKHYTAEEMRRTAEGDRLLRTDGSKNLLDAAAASGVRRYIVQSTGFYYQNGPGPASEEVPLALNGSPDVAARAKVYADLERSTFAATGMESVALRYGFFYGPGTWFNPDGDVADQVRAGAYPILGDGGAIWSWVHIADAAAATVTALECSPGIYNVVDDDPSPLAVWLPAFAASLGAPSPKQITDATALKQAGPEAMYYATKLRGASNQKAKEQIGFSPRRLEWLKASNAVAAQ